MDRPPFIDAPPSPPPMEREPVVFDPVDFAMRCDFECAAALAGIVSDYTGLPMLAAHNAIASAPQNMIALLYSPEGWAILARYAATMCGIEDAPTPAISVH